MSDLKSLQDISDYLQSVTGLSFIAGKSEAYLVGGAVRDILMGKKPVDFDVAVTGNPEEIAQEITKKGGVFFTLGKNRQKVHRCMLHGQVIDIAGLQGESIESDILKRDFTINAISLRLKDKLIIDPAGGITDLENKTIRMVTEHAFISDPLRMLRAYRFEANTGFSIEKNTLSAIKKHGSLIRVSAGERVREELLKLLSEENATEYLRKMSDYELLFEIIPELKEEINCSQNTYHKFNVWNHTLNTCDHLEHLLNGKENMMNETLQLAVQSIENANKPLLKLAALLHDVGKPMSRSVDEKNIVHFYGHEKKGAEISAGILSRLKFSSRDTDYMLSVINEHLKPVHLYKSHKMQNLKRKNIIRFFRRENTLTPHILIHAMADAWAKTDLIEEKDESFNGFITEILILYFHDFIRRKKEAPLINGNDLREIFGLSPSPAFKIILDAVEDARLSHEISSRESALDMARWLLVEQIR